MLLRVANVASGSLYEKYGGFAQINRIVMAFYDALLDSDEVGPYFDDIDMKRLIDHQTKFVSMILGGPADYSDERIHRAHSALNVTDPHFDEMKLILRGALLDNGIEAVDADLVMREIEARRGVIVK